MSTIITGVQVGTVFVDLDGTILRQGTQELLPGALEEMQRLREAGFRIVLTTRRGEEFGKHRVYGREATERALRRLAREGLPFDAVLYDCPSPRIVIDDCPGGHILHPSNEEVVTGEYAVVASRALTKRED